MRQEAEFWATQTNSRGGRVHNDETEVAVNPVTSPSLPTVTTATPPASSRIAVRKESESISAKGAANGICDVGVRDIVEGLRVRAVYSKRC